MSDGSAGFSVARFLRQTLPALIGVLFAVGASFVGFVVIPDAQVRPLWSPMLLEGDVAYPPLPSAAEVRGRAQYVSLGCIYCHSQQVRQGDFGGDISRGWGRRASVPLDYAREGTPLLGTMRTGPDLRNIGQRQPSRDWHLIHLYNPRIVSEGSIMPPFRFLFDRVDKSSRLNPPRGAIELPEAYEPEDAWIVPTPEVEDLVRYLQGLRYDAELPEGASRTRASADGSRR